MDTGVINRIAMHPTASSALPVLAAAGSNITQAAWAVAGFTTMRSIQNGGDDCDLDADSIAVDRIGDIKELKAPLSLTNEDFVLLGNGIRTVKFKIHGYSQIVLGLDSTMGSVGAISERGATITKRALAIEISGKGLDWYPNVLCIVDASGGGIGDVVTAEVTCYIASTTNQKSGHEFQKYS